VAEAGFHRNDVPCSSIAPQVWSTCGPRPRNDSDASAAITLPKLSDTCTRIGAIRLGAMWRYKIRGVDAPSARAAMT
jgi:hypothetical protein